MQIATYLPDFTVAEAERFWMLRAALCELVALGSEDSVFTFDLRRFVDNFTAEGLIPSEKTGEKRVSPRHYSALSAIMMRSLLEIMESGRGYKFAGAVAAHVENVARKLIADCATLDDIDTMQPVTLYATGPNGTARIIGTFREADFSLRLLKGASYDFGLLQSGEIIFNVLRGYADLWAKDLTARGLLVEEPRAIGADGWPLP